MSLYFTMFFRMSFSFSLYAYIFSAKVCSRACEFPLVFGPELYLRDTKQRFSEIKHGEVSSTSQQLYTLDRKVLYHSTCLRRRKKHNFAIIMRRSRHRHDVGPPDRDIRWAKTCTHTHRVPHRVIFNLCSWYSIYAHACRPNCHGVRDAFT